MVWLRHLVQNKKCMYLETGSAIQIVYLNLTLCAWVPQTSKKLELFTKSQGLIFTSWLHVILDAHIIIHVGFIYVYTTCNMLLLVASSYFKVMLTCMCWSHVNSFRSQKLRGLKYFSSLLPSWSGQNNSILLITILLDLTCNIYSCWRFKKVAIIYRKLN